MPLRCLLFSSNEQMIQPIWQVLADLGIEGEYCNSAVDAVERVTTHLFQIVVTDWEDQPEAAFLLKTARDLKAAQRPLILAIVGEDSRLPEALRAGANSVLVKPLRAEQVRDTMSTACQLLRSKLQVSAKLAAPVAVQEKAETTAAAAVATASVPAAVIQAPEKTFRAGEFLTSASAAPGAEFDTETECEVQKSLDQAAIAEVDALTELEPMASAVEEAEATEPKVEPQKALTGWASLQARLTKPILQPKEDVPAKNELLSYGDTSSHGAPPADLAAKEKNPEEQRAAEETGSEAALFDYMAGHDGAQPAQRPGSNRGKLLWVSALAVACAVAMAVPRTRRSLQILYHSTVHVAANWLNPPPAPLPQAVPQHDSFGQSGDEYKMPAMENIPDATTDPSQVRVLPVIDPTAKPEKNQEANSGQVQVTANDSNAAGQNRPTQNQPDQNQPDQNQPGQAQSAQAQTGQDPIKDSTSASVSTVPESATLGPSSAPSGAQVQPPAKPVTPQPRLVTSTAQPVTPAHTVSATGTGIPSSLKSQMASSTPDASGNKPAEAAMSAIEPVNLPEAAARDLLAQSVDPQYPPAAKATALRGSVVLQVVIGRDGAVQDVKFLQGSLMFARVAIDAVRQWRFKPYSMNGRVVSVQSLITLNFKPPA
jgi:TonB family protein